MAQPETLLQSADGWQACPEPSWFATLPELAEGASHTGTRGIDPAHQTP